MDAGDWVWIWLGVAVAFAFLELVTPFLFFMISFAVGAALAAFAALLDVSVGLQWAVFLFASGFALAVLVPVGRRIAHAEPEGDEIPEGAGRWVGRMAVVLEEIPAGPHATGLVRLERGRWRAETDAEDSIPADAEVEVLAVRGTRLVVAPPDPKQADPKQADPKQADPKQAP
jgi:membrane protein implicated in regulation of membrane protease activity